VLEFFLDYGLFLAKTVTIVLAIIIIAVFMAMLLMRGKSTAHEHVEIKKLNDHYDDLELALNSQMLTKEDFKSYLKASKQKHKKEKKNKTAKDTPRKRLFILDFHGDIKASEVTELREEITAILTIASPDTDEVFVRLESPGGMVHAYGLAASQLLRIRNKNIPLTIGVDKVAASGGYMMACVANKIISAPFAIVGSIGVVAQIPNFNRLLKKHDVDFELITAGEHKRTLTLFGENTDKAREKFKHDIEETHELFKAFILANRDIVDLDQVATGEHWFGTRAKELRLVDELMTSDDYLLSKRDEVDLYEVKYQTKKTIGSKFAHFLSNAADRLSLLWARRSQENQMQ